MDGPLVLGVARGHDASAVLMRGSSLLGIAEAERAIDVKHARGAEALASAVAVLCEEHGVSTTEIDALAMADTRDLLETAFPETVARAHGPYPAVRLGSDVLDNLAGGPLGFELRQDIKVFYVCHHLSHAASAVYQAGFEETAVLVVDGYGVCCGTIGYHYLNGIFHRFDGLRDVALLGWRYQLFGHLTKEISSERTDILDLAGKVMGLNAYGRPKAELVEYFGAWFRGSYEDYEKCWNADLDWFGDILNSPLRRDGGSVTDQTYLDIVASMQEAFAQTLECLGKVLLDETGSNRLVLSGGCALNVLANTRLAGLADETFFSPIAGDSGLSLGAASVVAASLTGVPPHHPSVCGKARRSPYLGLDRLDRSSFSPPALADIVQAELPEEDATTASVIAGDLAAGRIVGIVRGRSEVGPRALGNRSILVSGADPRMRERLNFNIKHREWWRPFAPVCRAPDAERFFEITAPSPYMLTIARVRPAFRGVFASACHEDGTARLQVVPNRDWHPLLWDILESFGSLTGVGVLINTSFNDGGKPILNRASTAFAMLQETNMHAVWIDGLWLHKRI